MMIDPANKSRSHLIILELVLLIFQDALVGTLLLHLLNFDQVVQRELVSKHTRLPK